MDQKKWCDNFDEIPYPFSIISVKDLIGTYSESLENSIKQGEVLLPIYEKDIRTELEIVVNKRSNQYQPMLIITQ